MKLNLKRIVAAGLATLAVSGVATISSISPAAAATDAGVATVKTSGGGADLNSGNGNTVWTLRLPAGANCATDGAAGGRWHTFMVPESEDIYTSLAFSGTGTLVGSSNGTGGTGTFRGNLANTTGTLIRNQAPNAGDAAIINIPDMQYRQADGAIPSGVYEIGIACTNTTGGDAAAGTNAAVDKVYSQTITVTYPAATSGFANIDWGVGLAHGAPAIAAGDIVPDEVSGVGQITLNDFTNNGGTSFVFQASQDGFSTIAGSASDNATPFGPFTVTGLTSGQTYDVRLVAQKAGFPDTFSNVVPVTITKNGGQVQDLLATDAGNDGTSNYVDIEWNPPAPVSGCTLTGYSVDAPSGATVADPDPDYTGTATESRRVSGVQANQAITITVTPTFTSGCAGTPATARDAGGALPVIVSGNLVVQNIDVTRPVGALVLTQVCGNNGLLPAEGPGAAATFGSADSLSDKPGTRDDQVLTDASVGFDRPGATPAIPASGEATVQQPWLTGAGIPSLVQDPPGGTASDQVAADDDPAYVQYPYPTTPDGVADPAPTTHCGLDLGPAHFVTTGTGAGQYFAVTAAMNQVTIVDTRNVDAGWVVSGAMDDFVASSEEEDGSGAAGALDSFSGDFLGWTPVVTEDTSAFDSDADGSVDYDQQVVAGPKVQPNTDEGLGDGSKEVLAQAEPGEGLGTAILDARLKLLIPVTADAGLYEGNLTFSAL